MSILDKLKSTVLSIAPALGSAIGGPSGAIAGALLSKVLTGKNDSNAEDLLNALQTASPETLLALKKADNDFLLTQQDLENQDIKSAREREIALAQLGKIDNTTRNLSYFITLGFFLMLFCILFIPIQSAVEQIAWMMFGGLSASFGAVIQYYFGSSIGSKVKDIFSKRT